MYAVGVCPPCVCACVAVVVPPHLLIAMLIKSPRNAKPAISATNNKLQGKRASHAPSLLLPQRYTAVHSTLTPLPPPPPSPAAAPFATAQRVQDIPTKKKKTKVVAVAACV